MIKKIIAILIVCCLGIASSWGEEDELPMEFERQFTHKEEKIIVNSAQKANEASCLIIRVYRGKKTLFQRERAAIGEGLQEVKFASPYLFLFWGAGVHGQAVTVLDVDKEKVIWEKSSSWPMNFIVQGKRVEIKYTGNRINPDEYEKFSKIFRLD